MRKSIGDGILSAAGIDQTGRRRHDAIGMWSTGWMVSTQTNPGPLKTLHLVLCGSVTRFHRFQTGP
jgi:hypothetical protein